MNSIKEKILELCKTKNISLHKLEMDLGFGNGTIRKWDKNTPNIDRLQAVANYFGIAIQELIEINTETKDLSFDDFTYAFYNESKDLTDENKQKLLELARFFKEQQEKEK